MRTQRWTERVRRMQTFGTMPCAESALATRLPSRSGMAAPRRVRSTIFDVDGVLVNSPHERAWREALAGFADPAQFTTTFYQAYVAGKPRLEGARSALERLGVANAAAAAEKYAEAKQALIDRLIEQGSFEAFPDAVRPRRCVARGRAQARTRLFFEKRRGDAAANQAAGRPDIALGLRCRASDGLGEWRR